VQAGYTVAFAVFSVSAVATTGLSALSFVRKSSEQGAVYALMALSFVARMVVSFALTNAASVNATAVNVISIVPFVIALFFNARLFERARVVMSSPLPFKFSPVFNSAYVLYGAGALALIALGSMNASATLADSLLRVLAALSIAFSVAFLASGVHSRSKVDVSQGRLTVVVAVCSLLSAIAWVAYPSSGVAIPVYCIADLVSAAALAFFQRRSATKEAPAVPAPKAAAEVPQSVA